MADKKVKDGDEEKKPLGATILESVLKYIIWLAVLIAIGIILNALLSDSFAKWRRNEAAEAAAIAFRQTERDERQYTVTVYPLSAGKPTIIKPGVVNFRLTVDQKHLGLGLKLIIQVDGYMSRRYVYDVDSNENLELRAKPGDRSKRVHYPPATYLECWIDPGSPVQKPATIWIEKLPQ